MSRYPLAMAHPHARQARSRSMGQFNPHTGQPIPEHRQDYQGEPDRFPPVTVHNEDQEAQHRALGYLAVGEAPPMPAPFAEYPLMMYHPDHVPAVPDETVVERDPQSNQMRTFVVPGKPAKFPETAAKDAAHERSLEKQGYKRKGQGDPAAAERAACGTSLDYKGAEWPKMVDGKVVDPTVQPAGPVEFPKWVRHPTGGAPEVLVKSKAEELAQLAKWGITIAPVPPVHVAVSPEAVDEQLDRDAPPLTRGQKAAATRAANKARKAVQTAA